MAAQKLEFTYASLAKASEIVRKGGLIVYPTDTVYGLGCDPSNETAVGRLFAAKRRESKPIPLMCDSYETASKLVSLSLCADELAKDFWPGALTIVAPSLRDFPFLIHQGANTLGVRVPGTALCRQLVARCGGVLTGTSANVSGRGSCRSAGEAEDEIGDVVDLILDGGVLTSEESTVVRVSGSRIEVLRQGAVRVTDKRVRG